MRVTKPVYAHRTSENKNPPPERKCTFKFSLSWQPFSNNKDQFNFDLTYSKNLKSLIMSHARHQAGLCTQDLTAALKFTVVLFFEGQLVKEKKA